MRAALRSNRTSFRTFKKHEQSYELCPDSDSPQTAAYISPFVEDDLLKNLTMCILMHAEPVFFYVQTCGANYMFCVFTHCSQPSKSRTASKLAVESCRGGGMSANSHSMSRFSLSLKKKKDSSAL